MGFFNDIFDQDLSGVAFKNISVKKAIVAYLSKNGSSTIADLCAELGLSTPKVNDVLLDLLTEGVLQDFGKIESKGGRRPNIYGLAPNFGYFLGIDVKRASTNIGITNFEKKLVFEMLNIPYTLKNDEEALHRLCEIISQTIADSGIEKSKILGAGVSLPGRINQKTGQSYNAFNFDNISGNSLQQTISETIGIRVFLENDSRAMALGELVAGAATGFENALFVNIGHGVGVGIIVNGQIYYGKSGYAGEFGHIPFFDNELICKCGKKGCLETEVSGWALIDQFKNKLSAGSSTGLTYSNAANITLYDILAAVNNDDVLAIQTLAEVGEKLGKGLAVLMNIFNPEIVVLGGSLATTGDYFRLPIKSALNKYSLSLVNNDTPLEISVLKEKSGVIGACFLASKQLLNAL